MAWNEAKPGAVASTPERSTARAQRGPVIATAELSKARVVPGESVELRLILESEPGWHIQSAKPSRAELVATSVELGLEEGLTPGEMRFPDGSLSPIGGEKLSVYAGKVTIRVAIQTGRGLRPGRLPGVARIRFQACDDKRCLAPEQLELRFAVEVA